MTENNGKSTVTINIPPCPPPPMPPCPPPIVPDMPKGTINYQLPQWSAQTATSWLTQLNYAMYRIDQIIHMLALRTAVDGVPEDIINDVAKLNSTVETMSIKLSELNNAQYDTKAQMASLQTEVTNLATQVQTLTTNLVNVDTRLSTVESKLINVEATLVKIQENLNTVVSAVETHNTTLADLEERVKALEDAGAAADEGEEGS